MSAAINSIHYSSRRLSPLRAAFFSELVCCCNSCRIPSSFTILRLSCAALFRKSKCYGSPNPYSRCNCRKMWRWLSRFVSRRYICQIKHGIGIGILRPSTSSRKRELAPSGRFAKLLRNCSAFALLAWHRSATIVFSERFDSGVLQTTNSIFTDPMRSLQLPIPPSLPRQISTVIFGMRHDRILDNPRLRWP